MQTRQFARQTTEKTLAQKETHGNLQRYLKKAEKPSKRGSCFKKTLKDKNAENKEPVSCQERGEEPVPFSILLFLKLRNEKAKEQNGIRTLPRRRTPTTRTPKNLRGLERWEQQRQRPTGSHRKKEARRGVGRLRKAHEIPSLKSRAGNAAPPRSSPAPIQSQPSQHRRWASCKSCRHLKWFLRERRTDEATAWSSLSRSQCARLLAGARRAEPPTLQTAAAEARYRCRLGKQPPATGQLITKFVRPAALPS